MSTTTIVLLVGGAAALYLLTRPEPLAAAPQQPGVYVPPPQAVPTYGGWASPSAPGASAWGMIPPQPTDAQQAAAIIGSLGALATGVGNAYSAFSG